MQHKHCRSVKCDWHFTRMRKATFGSRPQWTGHSDVWYWELTGLLKKKTKQRPHLEAEDLKRQSVLIQFPAPCLSTIDPLLYCPVLTLPLMTLSSVSQLFSSCSLSESFTHAFESRSCRAHRGSWFYGFWSLKETFWKLSSHTPYRFVDYVTWWFLQRQLECWSSVLECGLMITNLNWTKSNWTIPETTSLTRPGNSMLN